MTVDKAAAFATSFQTAQVGAIFTNHSHRRAATSISVEATAHMHDTEVGNSIPGIWSVGLIHPGQSLPVAITIALRLAPRCGPGAGLCPLTRVSFHTSVGAWINDTISKRGIAGRDPTFASSAPSSDGFSRFTLTAAIVNGYPQDLEKVQVSAICMDQSGKITSAGWGQVDILPGNGEAGETIGMPGNAPASPSDCQLGGWPDTPGEVGMGG